MPVRPTYCTDNYDRKTMATKAWIAKQKRREALVKKYADIRRQLKKEKNFAGAGQAAARFQPDALAQPLPAHRPRKGVLRKFKVCRIMLRELALAGKIPGLKKASWW